MTEVMVATFDRDALGWTGLGEILVQRGRERWMQIKDLRSAVTALVELLLHCHGEAGFDVLERNAVLRPLGSGKRGLDLRKLELEHIGEDGVRRRSGAIQALGLGVSGDQCDLRGRPAGIS